jgi:hypothetical protein
MRHVSNMATNVTSPINALRPGLTAERGSFDSGGTLGKASKLSQSVGSG